MSPQRRWLAAIAIAKPMATAGPMATVMAMVMTATFTLHAHAADLNLPQDGWASWEVAAVEGAPAWCCFSSWDQRDTSRMACRLDQVEGYNIGNGDATTATLKVYARMSGGRIDRLQALSTQCPVETLTPVQHLGHVSTDDSARWLGKQVKRDESRPADHWPIREGAFAALAVHQGDYARDLLADFARRDTRMELRKSAVFWLALLRGREGAAIARESMFDDRDSQVRQHAAFALTQSRSPDVGPELIRQGRTDRDAEVRAQAWFWLAQSGASDAERAISEALRQDDDARVREQAVFALSQLPDERGTRALIAIAEDQSLTREQRKRAIFWLSQSDSSSAQAYLDQVLARIAR